MYNNLIAINFYNVQQHPLFSHPLNTFIFLYLLSLSDPFSFENSIPLFFSIECIHLSLIRALSLSLFLSLANFYIWKT